MQTNLNCTVAPPIQCNTATLSPQNATLDATQMQQFDLIALSKRILARNQRNQLCNIPAINELHTPSTTATHSRNKNDAHEQRTAETNMNSTKGGLTSKSCAVALPKERNYATQELKRLVKKVSMQYGGDDETFLAEYTGELIQCRSCDLDRTLACFQDLLMLEQDLYSYNVR